MRATDIPLPDVPVSRRKALHGLAGLGGFALGGAAFTVGGAEPARAAVTLGELSIADKTAAPEDGALHGVYLDLDGSYKFTTKDFEATGYRVSLIVADQQKNYAPIATVEGNESGFDGAGSFSIVGNVLAHDDFDGSDFTAGADGSSISTTVHVRLKFEVLVSGSTLTDAIVEEAVVVTVTNQQVTASLDAQVGAEGVVVPQDNSGDAVPS